MRVREDCYEFCCAPWWLVEDKAQLASLISVDSAVTSFCSFVSISTFEIQAAAAAAEIHIDHTSRYLTVTVAANGDKAAELCLFS